jgi:hypothetical protein
MKKIVLALAAAGTALAFATPAAAQYYPAPAYAQPYGNAYGYQNNWGQVRSLQVRINNVQRQIRQLDRVNRIRDDRADSLRREANNIENRLQRAARYGLNGYEANDINIRIARLEQRVQYSMAQRFGRNWNRGYSYGYSDRDRDGRNDRYEDDRGYRHD